MNELNPQPLAFQMKERLSKTFAGDRVIWIIFMVFCLVSVVEVFSAGSMLTYTSGNYWHLIIRQSAFLLIGVALLLVADHLSYKWFQALPTFLLPFSMVMLILVFFYGQTKNAADRWYELFGIGFQPSELGKMGAVIAVAYILAKGQNEQGASPKAFKYCMFVAVPICGLIFPENFSTAVLLFGTIFLMMIIGRVAARLLWYTVLAGVLLLAGLVTYQLSLDEGEKSAIGRSTTWESRITNFIINTDVPPKEFKIDETNSQAVYARIAVASSGLLGKGPGNSVQRDFLASSHTDFIYAITIEELGLVPAAIILVLYLILLIRAGRIAKKCDRAFPAFLVLGIAILMVSQALFNMAVAVGLAPITGQPLPLISRGGTSTVINCIYIGMILSVSRYTAKLDKQRDEQEAQRLHDELIPMEVTIGGGDAQTADDPSSERLKENDDTAFT
ncbi:MAG: FtsW/RodA/SpoVE family cell cycle protein [Prevotellaceae bacterium]|jgi:cell division protein FtsW|nr:FtsW/RodA/SpoVE family cell cycle protein [Prevotellaceae bacterium]